jgi:hypothetical protein
MYIPVGQWLMFRSDAYWKLRVARVAGFMMDPSRGCAESAAWAIFVEALLPLVRPRSIVGEGTRLPTALSMFMSMAQEKAILLSYVLREVTQSKVNTSAMLDISTKIDRQRHLKAKYYWNLIVH